MLSIANRTPQHSAHNQISSDFTAPLTDPTTPISMPSAKKPSPPSSCSNSPNSVRLNQNYDGNNVQKSSTNTTNHINNKLNVDSTEAGDNEPLLQSGSNAGITPSTKRTNSRYGKSDEKSARDSDNENETLIRNNEC